MYDQVFVLAWPEMERDTLALSLCGRRQMSSVDDSTFKCLARKVGESESDAIEVVNEVVQKSRVVWEESDMAAKFGTEHAERLRAHWDRVPLLKARGPLRR
jgi:hypothetical protein